MPTEMLLRSPQGSKDSNQRERLSGIPERPHAEIQESEEDVYVLFNLPPPDGHRLEAPAAWDSPAAALLSLSSNAHYGEAQDQVDRLAGTSYNSIFGVTLKDQPLETVWCMASSIE